MESIPPTQTLQIGDVAPVFQARSTKGAVSLTDYRWNWLVLFSHPADFTPVCTSEFVAIAEQQKRFDAMDCALLAISVDSLFAHYGWIKAIRDHIGVEVGFPIIEDPSQVICRAYGMISDRSQDASAMRSSFYIDPNGIIRAITSYPATIGRSVDEMVRIVAALQRVDKGDALTPEGWLPGQSILLPPPVDPASFQASVTDPLWFYRLRDDKK